MKSDLLWSFDQLVQFTRYEDSEVRFWAAERLASIFPERAADPLSRLIMDDHDTTPDLVAEHLGRHGASRHVPVLLKGFRHGTDLTPGRCVEALSRLEYESTPDLAEMALHRKGTSEGCLGIIVLALAEDARARRSTEAADRARDFLLRRSELFAEPSALKGAVALYDSPELPDLILKWITALHFKSTDRIEPCIRVMTEEFQLEDFGWCLRTDRDGRVDLSRTLKAIESGYDVELRSVMDAASRREIDASLRTGQLSGIAAALASYIRRRISALPRRRDDDLPSRLDALASSFQTPAVLEMAEQLQPVVHQWLIGLLVATAVKATIYRNYRIEIDSAGDDLQALLVLADTETSSLQSMLPPRLSAVAEKSPEGRGRIIDWCLGTIEARGPFYPKSVALETLGSIGAADLLPEICAQLADENPPIYGAAERALSLIGRPVIEHTRQLLSTGHIHPDALHGLMRVSCEQGRTESLRLFSDFFDETFETLGPDCGSELAAIVAHQDLLPHLRRWLDRSPAMVGHTILLIGALHNLPIPEEESILQAIDDYWKGTGEMDGGGPSGSYLM